ncbi:MAG: hypothetical protein ACREAU_02085, partial [Nitrosopumilaceae archaeon]
VFYRDIAASKTQLGGDRTGEGFNVPSSAGSSAATIGMPRTSPSPANTTQAAPPQKVTADNMKAGDRIDKLVSKSTIII